MYKFIPPAYNENPLARNQLMFRCLTPQGYAVLKKGSTFTEMPVVSLDEVNDYDKVWLGGYIHYVSDEDGTELAAAGYNAVPVSWVLKIH